VRSRSALGLATRPASQPRSSTRLRPKRSARRPATKFIAPLTTPNATTKATNRMKEPRGTPNSPSASAGTTLRIIPMVMPTRSTCSNCCKNWARLTRIPKFNADGFTTCPLAQPLWQSARWGAQEPSTRKDGNDLALKRSGVEGSHVRIHAQALLIEEHSRGQPGGTQGRAES